MPSTAVSTAPLPPNPPTTAVTVAPSPPTYVTSAHVVLADNAPAVDQVFPSVDWLALVPPLATATNFPAPYAAEVQVAVALNVRATPVYPGAV